MRLCVIYCNCNVHGVLVGSDRDTGYSGAACVSRMAAVSSGPNRRRRAPFTLLRPHRTVPFSGNHTAACVAKYFQNQTHPAFCRAMARIAKT